jgi:hypothetical protein
MPPPRRLADATGVEGHIHDVALDVRRLAGVGIRQEKRAAVLWVGAAPIPWLALSCCAMAHNIRTWTVGAVQDWDHHDVTLVSEGSLPLFLFSRRADQHLWNTFSFSFPSPYMTQAMAVQEKALYNPVIPEGLRMPSSEESRTCRCSYAI